LGRLIGDNRGVNGRARHERTHLRTQTNDADRNEVVAFDCAGDGRLTPLGRTRQAAAAPGSRTLASQSSVILSTIDEFEGVLATVAGLAAS
jgi:hypothetical protein